MTLYNTVNVSIKHTAPYLSVFLKSGAKLLLFCELTKNQWSTFAYCKILNISN